MKRKADEQGGSGVKRKGHNRSDPRDGNRNQDDRYVQPGGQSEAIIAVQGCPFSPCRVDLIDNVTLNGNGQTSDEQVRQTGASSTQSRDGVDLSVTSQGPGVHKCGPSVLQMRQTGATSTQSRDSDDLSVTSQGPGVQKCGPSFPQVNEEHHSKRLRTSEAGVNRQQECESFYIGGQSRNNKTRPLIYNHSRRFLLGQIFGKTH